ncbi:MAG: zinc-dependent metalloprotease [Candidatus Zixiibacteriota bacterium]|nr:MAG: zinc-dependent metalloprotease [candidate division Zixibacteria bacterium]
MFKDRILVALLTVIISVALGGGSFAERDHSYWSHKAASKANNDRPQADRSKEKPFESLIKDRVAVEGLFAFYKDTVDNSVLMEIKPEQFDQVYLCGMSVSHGDGAFVEGSRMFGTIPFYFKRVGKTIMMLEKNIRVRADTASPLYEAVVTGISNSLIASTQVKSKPHDSTGAILVDPTSFFIRDAINLGFFFGQQRRNGLNLDAKNSYFDEIKSFPGNTELDVVLHFKTSRPMSALALQNAYSFFHTFHYSLSTLPETDYVPRLADERVGHFMSIHQAYDRLDTETPYVRYINRWHLKKKNPDARISEPVEPIVFWIENRVPEEYRDAIAEGIEFWNPAFEKIGFRNAMIAKEMPDTAEWDPADVRYSTIRWLVAKNYPYTAIGTSRANPFTGQIYDADIGFVSEAIRSLFGRAERRIVPLSSVEGTFEEYDPFGENFFDEHLLHNGELCQVGNAAFEAAFGMSYVMATTGDFEGKDSLTRELVHAFLTFVTAHEVGHTLGFKHNFIASTVYDLDQINDRAFTLENSGVGSVMEYPAANVAGPEKTQGEFYPSVPGPYDNWIIEYSYADFGAESPEEELPKLREIASRAGEPTLAYASDEDAFGSSVKSINPLTNIWDLGNDPLEFAEHNIKLSREIWFNLIDDFETEGTRYPKIRNVFRTSFTPFLRAASLAPKYVGGIYHKRMRVGDYEDELPFEVVPASLQRRAVAFLREYIFAPDAFDLPAELVNKLQEENLPDFMGTIYTRPTIDFPLHQMVLGAQESALSRLYSAWILQRLINNLERYKEGEEKYTMYDMFTEVRRAIWGEIVGPENVNSFRRQLQLAHLDRIINIYLSRRGVLPPDARTLAANDLDILENAARAAAGSSAINDMTVAHFKEVLRQIESAKEAKRQYTTR